MTDKPSILIVDDDPELRESLRNALETNEFAVAEAGDVMTALDELKKSFFNIVLLDIHLPDLCGLDGLTQIKEINQYTKVVMITAFASPRTAIEALNKAAFGYLEKPVDMNKLMNKLSRALAQQREELFMRKPLSSRLTRH
jgi:DNA-binding NtrC family response regulator